MGASPRRSVDHRQLPMGGPPPPAPVPPSFLCSHSLCFCTSRTGALGSSITHPRAGRSLSVKESRCLWTPSVADVMVGQPGQRAVTTARPSQHSSPCEEPAMTKGGASRTLCKETCRQVCWGAGGDLETGAMQKGQGPPEQMEFSRPL